MRIRPAAAPQKEDSSARFYVPEEDVLSGRKDRGTDGFETDRKTASSKASSRRAREEKQDTLKDPVFYEDVTDEMDVKTILRMARGEEPAPGKVQEQEKRSPEIPPVVEEDGDAGLPEESDVFADVREEDAGFEEDREDYPYDEEDDLPGGKENREDYLYDEEDDLPGFERFRRRTMEALHARAEAADEREMQRHLKRARAHFERLESMEDQLRAERAEKAEINRQKRIRQDAAWKEQKWFEEALRREIEEERALEERRAQEEQARREAAREKAEAARRAGMEEQARREAALEKAEAARRKGREEPARGDFSAHTEQVRRDQTSPLQEEGIREEAWQPGKNFGTAPSAGAPAAAASGRVYAPVEEEAVRRARQLRARRRAREDAQSGFERFLGRYGLSTEAAVRLVTLFLIAILGIVYVMDRGSGNRPGPGSLPAAGMTGTPALAEPDAEDVQMMEEEDTVPTGGGDF